LRADTPLTLSMEDLTRLRSLNDPISLEEVVAIYLPLSRLLVQASHTDRVIKGLATGDAWSALTALTGGLAGALQATPESGRVHG